MQKLLMLTIELPFPPNSGGRMKSWNMLKYLTNHFEVSLACPIKYGMEEVERMQSQVKLHQFLHDKVEIPRSASTLAQSYVKGVPINVYRTQSLQLKKEVSAIIHDYDVVLMDHYESAQYLPADYQGKVVFHAHNATYLMWERYACSDANLLYRAVTWLEGKRVKNTEIQICNRSDMVFASPNDIDSLVQAGGERAKFRETYHLGDDTQLELPPLNFKHSQKNLLYIGTLSWEANVDGLLWFFSAVWPKLVTEHPDLKLKIVGSKPDPTLIAAAAHDSRIEFLGFVEDLEPMFQSARLFLAPLRFGSGIKVKVLNAMCRGLPTITTPVGAEGIAARHMEHLSITESPDEMAASILHLLVNESDWSKLERNSRELIRDKYTWKKVLGYMVEQINSIQSK